MSHDQKITGFRLPPHLGNEGIRLLAAAHDHVVLVDLHRDGGALARTLGIGRLVRPVEKIPFAEIDLRTRAEAFEIGVFDRHRLIGSGLGSLHLHVEVLVREEIPPPGLEQAHGSGDIGDLDAVAERAGLQLFDK